MDKKERDKQATDQPTEESVGEALETEKAPETHESIESGQPDDSQPPASETSENEAESQETRPGSRLLPWLTAGVLLLFVAAALGGFGGWKTWQLLEEQQAEQEARVADLEQVDERVAALQERLQDTRSEVDALEGQGEAIRRQVESALRGQQNDLAERQDRLDARIAQIDDRLSRGEIAWKTAEIGFLLTRAQERLVIARDPDGAVLALQLADERVADLSRPHWLPLRSAISDAIGKIEAAGEGDRIGQALALRRLGDRVESWPLAGESETPERGQDELTDAAEPLPADAAWYEKTWAGVTDWLGRQVSVTRSDTPTRLRERVANDREMRLWLTAVRESLLARDVDGLRATVAEARDWLTAHYDLAASGPAAAQKALETTQNRFGGREFPSLDAVLTAWEKASEREKARTSTADGGAPEGKETKQ
ncbi:uroporphyrinogen-III C-methyltransferase [Guyparkeria sp. 1SP6A2]|nr:uroporphyrinogen-III C-methyltransferase [Guyparkeria sp. 1SP6A2]